MDVSVYSRSRVFEQPHLGKIQVVGIWSVLWAFIGGPIYYWKKGAVIEAILLCVASTPFWAFDNQISDASLAALRDITTVIWAVSVAFAPVILMMSYRRRGWVERPARMWRHR
jgi:hypothetical protein